MRPRKSQTTGEADLFRARLDQIINMQHELAQLAGKIDWDWIDREIAPLYSDKGRPGIDTCFAIRLLLLKHIYGYPMKRCASAGFTTRISSTSPAKSSSQHEFPHERSDLSHWRKRLGDKLELLLAESLRVAHEAGALGTRDIKRVTADTTVQPKNVTFPTDGKLLHAAIEAVISHMKAEGHLGRCYLKGRQGDAANVILTAVGYNLRLVLAWLRILLCLFLIALCRPLAIPLTIKAAC
jgi:transposase, IS5 family